MQKSNLKQIIRTKFPVFDSSLLVEAISDNCQYFKLPANTELMHIGSYVSIVPMVISGTFPEY